MSLGLNVPVRERRFVCDVVNCCQKFVSASAVARHVARAHQTDDSSNGKVHIQTLVSGVILHFRYVNYFACNSQRTVLPLSSTINNSKLEVPKFFNANECQ